MDHQGRSEERVVGVVGAGTVGVQLSAYLLSHYPVVLRVNSVSKKEELAERVGATRERWKLPPGKHLSVTTEYADLAECAVVIEATNEVLAIKRRTFQDLDQALPPEAMIWTTTSSIPIDLISAGIARSGHCLGFHPFVPINRMRLIEVVKGRHTEPSVVAEAVGMAEQMGKMPVVVDDRPGFVVNKLLFIQLQEALRMLDKGYAGIEDIDRSVKMGLNHPLGPFELMDMIGLDVCTSIFQNLESLGAGGGPWTSTSLERLVHWGVLGRETKAGFYIYGAGEPTVNPEAIQER
jgi:3-hydroxybutyryl-CoA dehydrogenase